MPATVFSITSYARHAMRAVVAIGIICAVVLGVMSHDAGEAQSISKLIIKPTRVIGTLAVQTRTAAGAAGTIIELPDVAVTLNVAATKAIVSTGKTGLDGRFDLVAPRAGIYFVCWTVGGIASCSNRIVVRRSDVSARIISAPFKTPLLFGKVLTGDNRPCWINDTFFNLDVSTQVSAAPTNGSKAAVSVRANVQGEYAMLGLAPGIYRLEAACEKAQAGRQIRLGGVQLQNLALPNRAPRLAAMTAKIAGGVTSGASVLRAAPGSKLILQSDARDPDQDKIEYMWRTNDPGGTVEATDSKTQGWALPNRIGLHSAYLIARDNKGGYAYRRYDIRSGSDALNFSGRAVDEVTLQPVRNAVVSLGTETTRTNAQGWFVLPVKPQDSERYVLNIKHLSYVLMSRVYDREQSGSTYQMIRAQVGRTSADGRLNFVDTGSSGPCGTTADQRPRQTQERATRRFADLIASRDGKGQSVEDIRRFKAAVDQRDGTITKRCIRRGVQIRIPSSGLVDAQGRKASGMITSSLATLDPTRRALPGDYRAVAAGGEETQLLSFGAVYAEFRGPGGELLNLAPGQEAELRIPVPAANAAAAKPSIALWSYDEARGRWVEEGEANLVDTPQGRFYVGKTKHFSTINMDIKINDGTCARLHVPPGAFTGWSNLTLRAYVSFGGTTSQVKETVLDGNEYHGIFRIPFGAATAPNTLRLEVRGTFDPAGPALPAESVLLNDIINIDAIPPNEAPIVSSSAISYAYPYDECGTPIELALPAGVVPDYGLDATGRPFFLNGPYGSYNPVGFDPNDYYDTIDPGMAKTTLGAWWGANGFDAVTGLAPGNASFTRASYLNHNDLGFGRDMHCAKSNNGAGPNLACYVTNYGLPDQNLANADAAATQDAGKRGATVTMEYDASAPVGERVQFYVFGGGVDTSVRIGFADLDGFGPKPVPQLCTICHGGNYNDISKKAIGSNFREFDLPSFKYPAGKSWDYPDNPLTGANPSAGEFGAFAKLNEMVRDIEPTGKIGSLINAWYTGGFGGNPLPVLPAPPAQWATDATTYHGAYAQACRTCHLARTLDFSAPGFVSADFTNINFTSYVVCGSGRVMPNAVVTYKNFWANTALVNGFESVAGLGANTCRND